MPIAPGTHVVYTIRPGDTLQIIADRFGSSVPAIAQANAIYPPITEFDLIYPGWKLLIRLPGMSQLSAVLHQATEGDTMYRLAERYAVGLDLLAAINEMERPDLLQVARLVSIPAFVYEIEPGDTLSGIARRFGLSVSQLLEANEGRPGLSPDLIYAGFRLAVPLPSSTNIAVFSPLPGTRIAPGQVMTGVARAFEANVLYQIRDAEERVVTPERAFTASAGGPAFGTFAVPLEIAAPPLTTTGSIWVYTRSALDGSIQYLVVVPILF